MMRSFVPNPSGTAGWAVALLLAGLTAGEARAQSPVAPQPAPAAPGWSTYVPGRGWVGYTPPSAPVMVPSYRAPAAATVSTVPPGWAGYAPARAWYGYAPASSTLPTTVRVNPAGGLLPFDGSRRRAANRFVNGNAPQLSYTLPSYREFGSGRPVPLAKPWLPGSP
jgi:hypothetical protein